MPAQLRDGTNGYRRVIFSKLQKLCTQLYIAAAMLLKRGILVVLLDSE
jgi:hypothetical protein